MGISKWLTERDKEQEGFPVSPINSKTKTKPDHKTNVPPTTEISLTLTLEEWFAIIAVLKDAEKNYRKSVSAYGLICLNRGGDKIVAQLTEWSKQ